VALPRHRGPALRGLFLGYTVYRNFYHEAFHEASRSLDVFWGGLNTVILITSSLTVALAYHCIKQARASSRRP